MKSVLSLAVVLLAGAISACSDTEAQTAPTDVSRAEFDALSAKVTALEANQPGDKAYSADPAQAASSGFTTKAASSNGRALGTALAFKNGLPSSSDEIELKSSTGYLYRVYVGTGTQTAPTNHEIFYESADCTGQGYMANLSDYGAKQGYVFTITANGGTTWDNPAQFYYVPAGSVRAGTINFNSRRSSIEEFCAATSGTEHIAFPAQSNDPAVTGVENGPISLPITIQ